jgi:hypothetical protein
MQLTIPQGCAACPVCNGTSLQELSQQEQKYSWNKGKTHCPCQNCGGQTMFGKAAGYTKIDPETGTGCKHSFVGRKSWKKLHEIFLYQM